MTYFRSKKSFREFIYDRGTTFVPNGNAMLKEAALSGGSYLGCLQSVKKKTEAPFLLALHGTCALATQRITVPLRMLFCSIYSYVT